MLILILLALCIFSFSLTQLTSEETSVCFSILSGSMVCYKTFDTSTISVFGTRGPFGLWKTELIFKLLKIKTFYFIFQRAIYFTKGCNLQNIYSEKLKTHSIDLTL